MGALTQMTNKELQSWWQEKAIVKVYADQVRLYRPMINKKRKLYFIPKVIYKLKDYKNTSTLVKQIIKDLPNFFQIKGEF